MMLRPKLSTSDKSVSEQIFRGVYTVIAMIAVVLIGGVMALAIGLLQGYRPVVLTSGSMTPTAPIGSVVVARPVDTVQVGDILVMSNEARATVTHRIVELETADDGQLFAVTRGDANSEIDAAPFPVDGPQLVGRWVVPGLGNVLLWLGSPLIGLVVVGGAVLVVTMSALSYIWGSSGRSEDDVEVVEAPTSGRAAATIGQKRFALGISLSVLFGFTGLAWSLYLSVDAVPGNAFSTSDCFDARLAGVQSGQVTSSTNGVTAVTIAPVEPTASFVTYSVRSADSKPGDTMVLGNLADATTVEFLRQTDTATPPPIVIEWSVVEFDCGVTVQRATGGGNGTSTVDFAVTPVDPATSFVIGGNIGGATETGVNDNEAVIVELVGTDTVRFWTEAPELDTSQAMSFQLVEFADAGDISTQVVTGIIPAGSASIDLTLPQPVGLDASMVLATFVAPDVGSDIGQRMIRARLTDETTVEVQRTAGDAPVEVSVQVVHFLDGTTVQSGVIDLSSGTSSAAIPIRPVDLARSTVGSTVLLGGASAVGSSDELVSGVAGEGLVTASFADAATLDLERSATGSNASFAWQVVTWGGPGWGDPNSTYRQRIDVDAGTVNVPSGYTTPVTIDHSALVASGLSAGTGDDLRLWRFDGTSWTELDRVLDENSSWNDASTTFWFRTQESVLAASTISYWLYFGDQAPPPPLDDPANVWLIDEGFESGLGAFEDRTEGTSWYRADPWTRRSEITIDSATVSSPLVDQTVLVRVASPDLAAAQSDGSDIYFTDAGGTVIPHAIESRLPGTLEAWVRVPALSDSADTTIFMIYGAPDAPAQADPRAAWNTDGIVWRMGDDDSGSTPVLDDQGVRNIDGLALADAALVRTVNGYVARLDGALDRLESEAFTLPDAPFTVAASFNADTIGGDVVLVAQGDPGAAGVIELGIDATTNPGSPTARAIVNLDGAAVTVTGGALAPGTQHHIAVVWDQATLELYVDGVSVASIAATGALPASRDIPAVLGAGPTGASALDGDLGQVRIRFEASSASRLRFEAVNVSSASGIVVAAPTIGTFRDQGDWTIRRPLLVSSDITDTDVVDFPLLVQLVDADLGSAAQVDGDDLVFTAADGVTRLDHHLESWDSGSGALTAWVRVPLVSAATDTELFVYVGNPAAGDQSDPVGVWGSDADLVLGAR